MQAVKACLSARKACQVRLKAHHFAKAGAASCTDISVFHLLLLGCSTAHLERYFSLVALSEATLQVAADSVKGPPNIRNSLRASYLRVLAILQANSLVSVHYLPLSKRKLFLRSNGKSLHNHTPFHSNQLSYSHLLLVTMQLYSCLTAYYPLYSTHMVQYVGKDL